MRRRGRGLCSVCGLDPKGPRLAIAGVTGAVGQELLECIRGRNFPYSSLKMLASARSKGKKYEFEGVEYVVEELTDESLDGVDIALFSAGGSQSKRFCEVAKAKGVVVVDNSSAFRMTPGVPLVVPEVNPEAMADVRIGKGAIIANPNCSTIIALMAVTPLHRAAGVKRMVASTYQAASGAGQAAMDELWEQTGQLLRGEPLSHNIWKGQYAFNLFSHNSDIDMETGYNEEELKLLKETRKIWNNENVRVTATCVRVPIMRAHTESINVELERPLTVAQARDILSKAPGVSIIDDRATNTFPTPLDASGKDDVYVGRIRQDLSSPEGYGLDILVCGDQIRKGAALNAIQIAEMLV